MFSMGEGPMTESQWVCPVAVKQEPSDDGTYDISYGTQGAYCITRTAVSGDRCVETVQTLIPEL